MPRKPALATLSADATGTTRASAVYDALRAEYKTNKGGFTPKNGVLQWPFRLLMPLMAAKNMNRACLL
jgi:hypothetical protein